MKNKIYRLLSFNMHKGIPPFTFFKKDLNQFINVSKIKTMMATLQIDFACLQELKGKVSKNHHFKSFRYSQMDYIAFELFSHYEYGKNAVYSSGDHGNAIFSRYPITHSKNVDLTLHRLEKRGLLINEILLDEKENKKIILINTHLNLREKDRQEQMKLIAPYLAESKTPTILCGDFNDWRATILIDNSFEEVFFKTYGRFEKTFPWFFPLASLDRVYMRGVKIHQAKRVDEYRHLSDHIPLYVEFSL